MSLNDALEKAGIRVSTELPVTDDEWAGLLRRLDVLSDRFVELVLSRREVAARGAGGDLAEGRTLPAPRNRNLPGRIER